MPLHDAPGASGDREPPSRPSAEAPALPVAADASAASASGAEAPWAETCRLLDREDVSPGFVLDTLTDVVFRAVDFSAPLGVEITIGDGAPEALLDAIRRYARRVSPETWAFEVMLPLLERCLGERLPPGGGLEAFWAVAWFAPDSGSPRAAASLRALRLFSWLGTRVAPPWGLRWLSVVGRPPTTARDQFIP